MNYQTLNVVAKLLSFNWHNVNQYDKRYIRKRLLRSAVSKRKKEMRSLKRSLSTYEKEIQNIFYSVDKFMLDRAVEKNTERSTKTTIKTHQKNIRNLTNNIALPFIHNETIHKLSTTTLTIEELHVLKSGLKHPTHPLHVNKTHVLTPFEFILKTMTKDLKHEKKVVNLKQNYQIWPTLISVITDHQSML